MAFAGRTTFNPATDTLPLPGGGTFRFTSPNADDLPARGFDLGASHQADMFGPGP
jgi:homoaconitase